MSLFIYKMGDGKTSFWCDGWLSFSPLCFQVPNVAIQEHDVIVREVFENGTWHLNKLYAIIPQDIKLKVESLYLNLVDGMRGA